MIESSEQAGKWPPKSCEMPDLSELNPKMILTLLLNRSLGGRGPTNPQSYALVMNFVRIVDSLVLYYELARQDLQRYISTPNTTMSPLFAATAHWETCITTIVRAINVGITIRGIKGGPRVPKTPVLAATVEKRTGDLRNAIEHIEGQFEQKRWVPDRPYCLLLKHDRLELCGEQIFYSEFAAWVRQLQKLSVELASYEEPAADVRGDIPPGPL